MGLRKRVIGAVVLVGLAVIFIPMLLNHTVTEKLVMDKLYRTPAEPMITFLDEQVIQVPSAVMPNTPTQQASATAWLIQLASFSTPTNAEQLVNKLQAQQYPAFVQPIKNTDTLPYRVMIGPFTQQEKIQQALRDLQQELALTGKIVVYEPITTSDKK